MIVRTLTRSQAEPYLNAVLSDQTPDPPLDSLAVEVGSPPRGSTDEAIRAVRERLGALIGELDQREVGRFDAEAAAIVHDGLRDLPVRVASNRDFWRYLACGPLLDITRWRAPSGARENFGIGRVWRAVPERLWFRGSIGADPEASDRYHLVRRGGVDFWESGLIRVLYSSNPILARALIRFQFPEEGEFDGASYQPARLGLEGIRELWKRLRHIDAVLDYATMDENRADALLEELAADLS